VLKKSPLFLYSLLLVSVLVFSGYVALPKASGTLDYYVLFVFKHNGQTITSIDTAVGSTYDLEVCIDNIPQGWSMTSFGVNFSWTPISKLEVVSIDPSIPVPPGTFDAEWYNSLGKGNAVREGINTKTLSLFVIRIHCLDEGTATMTFVDPGRGAIDIRQDGTDTYVTGVIPPATLVVNQHAAPPSGPSGYVGGELFSANKLAVLSPYLALISVVAVAAVVVRKKLS